MANSISRGVAYDDPELTSLSITGALTVAGAATLNGNVVVGNAITDTVGFYGTTPITQRAGAAQAALSPASLTTSAGGFGFYTATLAASLVAQVEEIRAMLVAYGLAKGAA